MMISEQSLMEKVYVMLMETLLWMALMMMMMLPRMMMTMSVMVSELYLI